MILGIDTSGKTCSVAVSERNNILGEFFINNGLTHSETLMPMIDTLLKTINLDIKEIKNIALSIGPGSFTGLRIGTSVAIAISQALKIKIVEVSTLESLAYNLSSRNNNDKNNLVIPIMDARRGQVYTAGFRNGIKIIEEQNILFEDLLKQIEEKKEIDEEPIFVGDATLIYEVKKPPSNLIFQRASSLCLLADEKISSNTIYDEDYNKQASYDFTLQNTPKVTINYLRKPQAERELDDKTSSPI